MANEIPVYMITGFLEGGKTSFLKFTLQQDYFNDGSKTLLILCEEGETELDQEFMDKYHVVIETIEEESELNREYFREVGTVSYTHLDVYKRQLLCFQVRQQQDVIRLRQFA